MTERSGSITTTDRLLQTVTALALLLTPVMVAVIGYRATNATTSKDYVSLAVTILNSKDSPKESRAWAATVLNKLSPVPVPSSLKDELGSGSVLVEKPVQVDVPIAVGCIDAKTYLDMHSMLPGPIKAKPHSLTDDQLINFLAKRDASFEAWAEGADKIMKNCSDLGVAFDKSFPSTKPATDGQAKPRK